MLKIDIHVFGKGCSLKKVVEEYEIIYTSVVKNLNIINYTSMSFKLKIENRGVCI